MASTISPLINLENLALYDEKIKALIESGDLWVGTQAEFDVAVAKDPDAMDGRTVLILDGEENTEIDELKESISALNSKIGDFSPTEKGTTITELITSVETETKNVTAEVQDIRNLFS